MPEIHLTVRHYRGIDHAELACSPIALLYADNGGGKSSVSEAVAATLLGNGLAGHPELKKGTADQLVQQGTQAGSAQVKNEDGAIRMIWPGCESHSDGTPPRASEIATGLVSIPEISSDKERAAALHRYLRADPTKEDLALEMQGRFSPESIDAVWSEIEAMGWDGTVQKYEMERRDAGREWQKVTNQNFGSDKAPNWRPEGWTEGLEDEDLDLLNQELEEAKADLAAAAKSAAVDDAQIASLRNYANRVEELTEKAAAAQKAADAAEKNYEATAQTRANLPAGAATSSLTCPHCSGAIQVVSRPGVMTLEKFTPPDPENLKKIRQQIAETDGALSKATTDRRRAQEDLVTALSELRGANRAAEELRTLESREAGPNPQEARDRVNRLSHSANALSRYQQAAAQYRRWLRSDLIIDITRPDGLRGTILGRAVEAFNNCVLEPLCEGAAFGHVKLTPDLHVYGQVAGRDLPYSLLSDGEKWRTRVVLQLACAKIDGSAMVIIDHTPDLDSAALNGALALLAGEEFPALVCIASRIDKPPPPIASFGYGNTYVIENGRAVLYTPPAQREEAA